MQAGPKLLIPLRIILVAGNLKTNPNTLRFRASSCQSERLKKTSCDDPDCRSHWDETRPHLFIPFPLTRLAPSAHRSARKVRRRHMFRFWQSELVPPKMRWEYERRRTILYRRTPLIRRATPSAASAASALLEPSRSSSHSIRRKV